MKLREGLLTALLTTDPPLAAEQLSQVSSSSSSDGKCQPGDTITTLELDSSINAGRRCDLATSLLHSPRSRASHEDRSCSCCKLGTGNKWRHGSPGSSIEIILNELLNKMVPQIIEIMDI